MEPARGQEEGTRGQAGDEPFTWQPLKGARDRDVGDAEPPRDINDPRFAGRADQLGNDLDVILRNLLGMLLPRPARMPMGQGGTALARLRNLGGGGRHSQSKSKKAPVDNRKMNL